MLPQKSSRPTRASADAPKLRGEPVRSGAQDAKRLAAAGLRPNARVLLDVLKEDPFQAPPPLQKPVGDLSGAYSRRITIQHRLVCQVLAEDRVVKVLRCGRTTSRTNGPRIRFAATLPSAGRLCHQLCRDFVEPECERRSEKGLSWAEPVDRAARLK
jgi:toxin YoeB